MLTVTRYKVRARIRIPSLPDSLSKYTVTRRGQKNLKIQRGVRLSQKENGSEFFLYTYYVSVGTRYGPSHIATRLSSSHTWYAETHRGGERWNHLLRVAGPDVTTRPSSLGFTPRIGEAKTTQKGSPCALLTQSAGTGSTTKRPSRFCSIWLPIGTGFHVKCGCL